jgi:hypothetical protein
VSIAAFHTVAFHCTFFTENQLIRVIYFNVIWLIRGVYNMEAVIATSWFDIFICVVVLFGIFGVLANLVYFYDHGHH